ncbi:MAG: alpha/beta fold hydrolase, partial [Pseudomonadota bacterium]
MPFAPIDDGELYYEVHGSGPPLLLIAGLGGLGSYWTPQIDRFSQHFTLIVQDHRGTGKSSRSKIKYSLEQMAQDTLRLMDALSLESAHLVGHSTGASIGQILAIEHPRRMG